MQTIGERLEEARKRKGISIREAAEQTKIRSDYLQKFEGNSFAIDLPALYIRGFLRTYARFLELDPERLVNDVDAALAREGKPGRREPREALGRVDFGTAESRAAEAPETGSGGRSAHDKAMMVKFGLLGGGAIGAILIIILLVKVLSNPTPQPAQAAQPAASMVQADAAQTLILTAVEPTRVKVVQELDDAVLLDNVSLAKGESRTIKKHGKLFITVAEGKNLRMEVNGRSYPVPLDGYHRFALD